MFEAVNHPSLYPTSLFDVYEVVEHLDMMCWMGIWVHPHIVTPVQVGAKFRKTGERMCPNYIMVLCLRL